MTVSLTPFWGAVGVTVEMDPLTWAVGIGKTRDHAPRCVPGKKFPCTVFIDTPCTDPEEAGAWALENYGFICRKAKEAFLTPPFSWN